MAAAQMQQEQQQQQQQRPADVVQFPSGRYKSMGRSGACEKDMDYTPKDKGR